MISPKPKYLGDRRKKSRGGWWMTAAREMPKRSVVSVADGPVRQRNGRVGRNPTSSRLIGREATKLPETTRSGVAARGARRSASFISAGSRRIGDANAFH